MPDVRQNLRGNECECYLLLQERLQQHRLHNQLIATQHRVGGLESCCVECFQYRVFQPVTLLTSQKLQYCTSLIGRPARLDWVGE